MKMRFFFSTSVFLSMFEVRYLNCIKFVVNKQWCKRKLQFGSGTNQTRDKPKQNNNSNEKKNVWWTSLTMVNIELWLTKKGFSSTGTNNENEMLINMWQHATIDQKKKNTNLFTYRCHTLFLVQLCVCFFFLSFPTLDICCDAMMSSNNIKSFNSVEMMKWKKKIGELSV